VCEVCEGRSGLLKTRAAVLRQQPGNWEVLEVDLDEPKQGEVLVRIAHSGLCHSDDHAAKGDVPVPLPKNGGHEGSGVVEAIGPGVESLAVGDHIVTSFVASCGKCRWCASGMQNLCDAGALFATGAMPDGTFRMYFEGQAVCGGGASGTFTELNVFSERCCIKIHDDIPLDAACLVGCGVPTGFGSAVHSAQVEPGDVVIVMGVGGVGANALQGAQAAGASRIIAVDLVASKREKALELGATDFTTSMDKAADLAQSLTNGQGADSVIITVGLLQGEWVGQALAAIRKGGIVAVTAVGPKSLSSIPVNLFELAMFQKRIQGVLYGAGSPRREVQRLLDMYVAGRLKLDELITARYSLSQINDGFQDMLEGKNIRGVIDF
jgi:NDMA-dependent alcohol dehydrogenase